MSAVLTEFTTREMIEYRKPVLTRVDVLVGERWRDLADGHRPYGRQVCRRGLYTG